MDGPRAWTQMCRTKHVPFAAKAVLYRDGESRRPAFLTRPVARNSPKRLRLSGYCRVTDQTSEDCLIRWRSKFIEVSGSDCFRKVWALLGWCTESGCMIGKLNRAHSYSVRSDAFRSCGNRRAGSPHSSPTSRRAERPTASRKRSATKWTESSAMLRFEHRTAFDCKDGR